MASCWAVRTRGRKPVQDYRWEGSLGVVTLLDGLDDMVTGESPSMFLRRHGPDGLLLYVDGISVCEWPTDALGRRIVLSVAAHAHNRRDWEEMARGALLLTADPAQLDPAFVRFTNESSSGFEVAWHVLREQLLAIELADAERTAVERDVPRQRLPEALPAILQELLQGAWPEDAWVVLAADNITLPWDFDRGDALLAVNDQALAPVPAAKEPPDPKGPGRGGCLSALAAVAALSWTTWRVL